MKPVRTLPVLTCALLLLGAACSSPAPAEKPQTVSVPPARSQAAALRTEYWPVDTTTYRADTLLANGYRLRWTSYSLNDSAVVDTVRDDQGPLL